MRKEDSMAGAFGGILERGFSGEGMGRIVEDHSTVESAGVFVAFGTSVYSYRGRAASQEHGAQ